MTLYNIVYLVSNVFMLYLIKNFVDIFLIFERKNLKLSVMAYIFYFVSVSGVYLIFNIPILNLITNLLAMFLICLCYEGTVPKKCFTVIIMYVSMFVVETLLVIISGRLFINPVENFQYNNFVAPLLSKVTSYILIFIFKNTFKKKREFSLPAPVMVVFMIIPVSTIIMQIMIVQIPDISQKISVASTIILLIVNISFYFIFDYITFIYAQKYMDRIAVSEREFYYNQCITMKKTVDETRAIQHDIKNHYSVIHKLIEADEKQNALSYIEKIIDVTQKNLTLYSDTGNVITDSIVNYKFRNKPDDVKIKTDIFIPPELPIEAFDLSVILTNLIDNALEGVSSSEGEKLISLDIRFSKGMLFINISNTFDGVVKFDNGQIVTKKDDKELHGQGLRNVRAIVEKHNGLLNITCENSIFNVECMIYP